MKFYCAFLGYCPETSPPARGAWIEMLASVAISMILLSSPPARGAWIEIYAAAHFSRPVKVAPRTGGVD